MNQCSSIERALLTRSEAGKVKGDIEKREDNSIIKSKECDEDGTHTIRHVNHSSKICNIFFPFLIISTQAYSKRSYTKRQQEQTSDMARIWDEMYFAEQMTTEAQLRQWVEADPRRVNDWDKDGKTPLYMAACGFRSLPLVLWLLDEKGADVNARCYSGYTALHWTCSLDILTVLLDRDGDPTFVGDGDWSPLTSCVAVGNLECLARLLQDPRVRAIVDVQDRQGWTALHKTCHKSDESRASYIFHLLLQAGASPAVMDKTGKTPSAYLRSLSPSHHTTIALLEQALDQAEKAALLVKARRLVLAAHSKAALPSHLQGRMDLALPLPRVELSPATDDGPENEVGGNCKFRTMLVFLFGMEGGPMGEGMPRDVFIGVMDLVMPSWDPMRRGLAGNKGKVQSNGSILAVAA